MTLPSVVRSGVTPYRACAPPGCTRKPVITSSKTSSASCSAVRERSRSRNPGAGGTSPMFPATGSTITAAISCSAKRASTEPRSLSSAVRVSATAPGVTPGESGSPRVATPDPACTSRKSACPW